MSAAQQKRAESKSRFLAELGTKDPLPPGVKPRENESKAVYLAVKFAQHHGVPIHAGDLETLLARPRSIARAAEAAGIDRTSVIRWRKTDPEFDQQVTTTIESHHWKWAVRGWVAAFYPELSDDFIDPEDDDVPPERDRGSA